MTTARHIHTLLCAALLCTLLCACSGRFDIDVHTDSEADIYPDYKGVTVPPNIAPLNFHIAGAPDVAAIMAAGSDTLWLHGSGGDIEIPDSDWKRLVHAARGSAITVTPCLREDGVWKACRPFHINVATDEIDRTLVYRLLPPVYGTWKYIGIYQRDLESFDETTVYRNDAYHGNCVNCHSFCARNPEKMQLHLRDRGGATYIYRDGERRRLDTKTDSTMSNFTYPYWHPSGRFIAYSVNNIFQVFHTSDPNRVEVIDDDSDVIVYDIDSNEAFSCPFLRRTGVLETFPAFSPDGLTLYFCTATHPGNLPDDYRDVHYSLCSVDFDPETRTFGSKVDTLLDAGAHRSVSFPRPSPDGRRLVATVAGYGNFSIWHKDADLWMLDLETGQWSTMDPANSADVESYHSWSGNSRWMVFSSRRDDGLYTRPYIVYIAEDGSVGKPFMLPQHRPRKYYADKQESYNIPELAEGPVPLGTTDIVDWLHNPAEKVKWKEQAKHNPQTTNHTP